MKSLQLKVAESVVIEMALEDYVSKCESEISWCTDRDKDRSFWNRQRKLAKQALSRIDELYK